MGYIYAKKSKIEPSFMSREGSVKLEALLRKKERNLLPDGTTKKNEKNDSPAKIAKY